MDVDTLSSKSGIARALGVLEHVRRNTPRTMGVTEIARELGMAKAVAYRILKDLVQVGYLAFDDRSKEYSLGGASILLGVTALNSMDTLSLARPHLATLVQRTEETATLSVRQGWNRVYIDQMESPQEIRMAIQLGSRHSLHAGASSKAILAALPDSEVEAYAELRANMGLAASDDDASQLVRSVRETRERGYALSLGEREASAVSVAAPIYAASGEVWGAISVCGPRSRFDSALWDGYAGHVRSAATQISLERAPFTRFQVDG